MGQVWYTSDPHFGHRFVADLRGYPNSDEMDAAIAEQWRRQVRKDDTVYVLGDLAVSSPYAALDILAELPGRKHLVAGNHDRINPIHRRTYKRALLDRYLSVFDTVATFRRLRLNGVVVLLSHFPYAAAGDGEGRPGNRYAQYRLPDMGTALIHGHTHDKQRAHGHMLHVGWDAWGELVPQGTVLEWLNSLGKEATA